MKTTYITDMEVCNTHGHEMIVDAFFMDDGKNRRVYLFSPGTTTEIEEVPHQSSAGLDIHEFEDNEMDGWWDHAAPYMKEPQCHCEPCTTDPGGNCVNCLRPAGPTTNLDKLLDLVANLIRADEKREDTSFAARAIREYFVDTLKRPDPLGFIPSDMPTLATVTEQGELLGQWPCGKDNDGHEEEYEYEGHRYIVGWQPGKNSWFYRKEDEEE